MDNQSIHEISINFLQLEKNENHQSPITNQSTNQSTERTSHLRRILK